MGDLRVVICCLLLWVCECMCVLLLGKGVTVWFFICFVRCSFFTIRCLDVWMLYLVAIYCHFDNRNINAVKSL